MSILSSSSIRNIVGARAYPLMTVLTASHVCYKGSFVSVEAAARMARGSLFQMHCFPQRVSATIRTPGLEQVWSQTGIFDAFDKRSRQKRAPSESLMFALLHSQKCFSCSKIRERGFQVGSYSDPSILLIKDWRARSAAQAPGRVISWSGKVVAGMSRTGRPLRPKGERPSWAP
jgi:hypothetical protein